MCLLKVHLGKMSTVVIAVSGELFAQFIMVAVLLCDRTGRSKESGYGRILSDASIDCIAKAMTFWWDASNPLSLT